MSKHTTAADAAFVAQQRKRLEAMRIELLDANAASVASSISPKADEAREREDDAQRLAQSDVDGALGDVEAQRLRIIDRALAKIEEGTYGFSDMSGDPIPKKRLEAMPEAVLTIEEEEVREKSRQR